MQVQPVVRGQMRVQGSHTLMPGTGDVEECLACLDQLGFDLVDAPGGRHDTVKVEEEGMVGVACRLSLWRHIECDVPSHGCGTRPSSDRTVNGGFHESPAFRLTTLTNVRDVREESDVDPDQPRGGIAATGSTQDQSGSPSEVT